jgi:hypothetical protein
MHVARARAVRVIRAGAEDACQDAIDQAYRARYPQSSSSVGLVVGPGARATTPQLLAR